MANHPKDAYKWEMGTHAKMDEYIVNGVIQLLVTPVEGSGWKKFKAHVVGLERITVKGEFDSPAEALAIARKLAIQLIMKENK